MSLIRKAEIFLAVLIIAGVLGAGLALAGTGISYQKIHTVNIKSGTLSNPSNQEAVVFSQVIDITGAPWVRLQFGSVNLEGKSYLRITSQQDGSTQIHNQRTLEEWENTSAYFNGSAVTVELVAGAKTAGNFVSVAQVFAADPSQPPEPSGPSKVCQFVDQRVPSANGATARLLITNTSTDPDVVGGCTGFIIKEIPNDNANDRLMLSAGHCFVPGVRPYQVSGVVQFNVPASLTTCFVQHPPATKQFYIHKQTLRAVNGGPGNDWAVFRCFRNTNPPNKTVFEEQGVQFTKAAPADGMARVYGYGVDGDTLPGGDTIHCQCDPGDVDATKSQTQQTDSGSITVSGDTVFHNIHTCGASSGSPIVTYPVDTFAVAIHESGGCTGGGCPPMPEPLSLTHSSWPQLLQ